MYAECLRQQSCLFRKRGSCRRGDFVWVGGWGQTVQETKQMEKENTKLEGERD
uniref:Uncharacterized protein n=1 Tax=Octopus bimaculoides TaxID=37653 RepID=A0A0L8FZ91_OCTBM